MIAGNGNFLKIDNWYVFTCLKFMSVMVDIMPLGYVKYHTVGYMYTTKLAYYLSYKLRNM
jgi:hypothetical protein